LWKTIMMRSLLFFALLVIVLAVLDQTQGLAFGSIVRPVRGSIWGKVAMQSAAGFPEARIEATPMIATPLSPAAPVVGGFDVDACRREMTDLVYQRSMERGFSS
jgi:hypothetical protein